MLMCCIELYAVEEQAERSGAGSVMIDSKKAHAIRHWMDRCSPAARAVVYEALQDCPFQYGPWGEQLSQIGAIFLQSTGDLTCGGSDGVAPLTHEDSVSVNWTLPLDEPSQTFLFKRIKLAFDRATAIIHDVRDKKKYRLKSEELTSLRNLCAFWSQVRSFCLTRIPDFDTFEAKLMNGNSMDDQFAEVLQTCPPQFSISMLPMTQIEAANELRRQEETVSLEAEQQRTELRAAKWKYFVSALGRDQKQLSLVAAAPSKLENLKHRKEMAWRVEQSKLGEKVVMAYSEKHLRCRQVKQMGHFHEVFHEYSNYVVPCQGCSCLVLVKPPIITFQLNVEAEDAGVKGTEIYMITFVDLNVPLANSKEKMNELIDSGHQRRVTQSPRGRAGAP